MKNSPQMKGAWLSRKYFMILTVCIMTGFILGYSYNISKDKRDKESISHFYTQQGDSYQEELIAQQERNKELSDELNALQSKILEYEQTYKTNEDTYDVLAEEAETLRVLLGELPGSGQGVSITLEDHNYNSSSNPNDYIVHESHVFSVINELKIAGAEAISINGQRLQAHSYISCNGPVITIDGNQYPAPFVIEAVGNGETLLSALEISGGVVDQLLTDHVVVTLAKKDLIHMPAITKGNS